MLEKFISDFNLDYSSGELFLDYAYNFEFTQEEVDAIAYAIYVAAHTSPLNDKNYSKSELFANLINVFNKFAFNGCIRMDIRDYELDGITNLTESEN